MNYLTSEDKNATKFKLLLDSLEPYFKEKLLSFSDQHQITLKSVQSSPKFNMFSASFKNHDASDIFITDLAFAGRITGLIINNKIQNKENYELAVREFPTIIKTYADFIKVPLSMIKSEIYFSLMANYQSLMDINYYEVIFIGALHNKKTKFSVKFYFEPIKPSFEIKTLFDYNVNDFEIQFELQVDMVVNFNTRDDIIIPFLNSHKQELSQKLGYPVESIDQSILDLVHVIIF